MKMSLTKTAMAFLLLSAACAHAETSSEIPQGSVFFSPDDARVAEALSEKAGSAGQSDIRLGALMYYSAQDWVLWLQGEKWTPQTSHDDLRILKVDLDRVRLSWHGDDGQPEREIILRPNETYQIATGKIITAR